MDLAQAFLLSFHLVVRHLDQPVPVVPGVLGHVGVGRAGNVALGAVDTRRFVGSFPGGTGAW